jgi:hypothetical protein
MNGSVLGDDPPLSHAHTHDAILTFYLPFPKIYGKSEPNYEIVVKGDKG